MFSIHFTSSGDNFDWALSGIDASGGGEGGVGSLHLKRDKAGDPSIHSSIHFTPPSRDTALSEGNPECGTSNAN